MSPKPDDLEILSYKYKTMNIDELKESIEQWEERLDCSNQTQILNIAKKELEFKYKERQEQIDLLRKSLSSSSRLGRWISSIRAIFN